MHLQKLTHTITGNPEKFSLEHRIFNFTAVAAIILALTAGIENVYLDLPLPLIASMFIYMLIMILLYYLSRFKGMAEPVITVSCVILLLFFTPAEWILNGGIDGGAHYTILIFGMVICAICSGWKRNFFIVLLLLMVLSLGIFEYYFPEEIYYHTNRTTKYIDAISTFIITIVVTVLLFQVFLKYYDYERIRVLDYTLRLEEMAITDGLTDLFNHTYLSCLLEDRLHESLHYNSSLSIIMFDLDHFKDINDTYGHEFGNKVLIEVANSLKNNLRSTDIIVRYGGEEFLIICPETTLVDAVLLAKRLALAVKNLNLGNEITVTLSGGVAEFDKDSSESTINLIEKADDALYAAKNKGRNRIALYSRQTGHVSFAKTNTA